eukprot:Gb_36058 [translate_table: standard]
MEIMELGAKVIIEHQDGHGAGTRIENALHQNAYSPWKRKEIPWKLPLESYGLIDIFASGKVINFVDSHDVPQVSLILLHDYKAPTNKSRWVILWDLREATCHGRDPEILDCAMRGLKGKIIGKHNVQCQCMSAIRILEYRLKDMDGMALEVDNESMIDSKRLMKEHLLEDLKNIYNALLHHLPTSGF